MAQDAKPVRLGLVGLGKIVRDQHLPAIAGRSDVALAATMSPHGEGFEAVPHYTDYSRFLEEAEIDAVVLCCPPQVRYGLASAAIAAGKSVFLEKPPGATLGEVHALVDQARAAGVTLFASWHSRYAAGIEPARDWLADKVVTGGRIVWREDVRRWHPNQAWIWEAGGLGVFDPGINALSILTRLLPNAVVLERAVLETPENRQAPIAASLDLRTVSGAAILVDLDWRQTGPQTWDIVINTEAGDLVLTDGGARASAQCLSIDAQDGEYAGLYKAFVSLVRDGVSDVDLSPFRIVADAFLLGRRKTVDAFED